MNITPLEIRQKVFEKAFRGFDKDEVSAFLNSMSIEWEKLNDQKKEFKCKLEAAEKEVTKLREVENSLFKTLKTAEDTGANMVEQATKTAELHMKETEMNADAIMNEAKSRAKSVIEEAEARARAIVDDMEDEIRELEHVFRSVSANKTTLMGDLKVLANDILDKLQRHEDFPSEVKTHVKKGKELAREVNELNSSPEKVIEVDEKEEPKETEPAVQEEPVSEVEIEVVAIEEEVIIEEKVTNSNDQEVVENESKAETEIDNEEVKKEPSKKKNPQEEEESFFDQFD
jgi:cell division initiation protein